MAQVKYANNFPDLQRKWKVFWKVFQIYLWSQSKKFKVESSELAYVSPPPCEGMNSTFLNSGPL